MAKHMQLCDMPKFCAKIEAWLKARYGEADGEALWEATRRQYNRYLETLPDYGGKKAGHALAIYGGIIFFHVSAAPGSPASRRTAGACHKSVYVRICAVGKDFQPESKL